MLLLQFGVPYAVINLKVARSIEYQLLLNVSFCHVAGCSNLLELKILFLIVQISV